MKITPITNRRVEQMRRYRLQQRALNPSIDPETGERIRDLTPVESYRMTSPSAWAVRF